MLGLTLHLSGGEMQIDSFIYSYFQSFNVLAKNLYCLFFLKLILLYLKLIIVYLILTNKFLLKSYQNEKIFCL